MAPRHISRSSSEKSMSSVKSGEAQRKATNPQFEKFCALCGSIPTRSPKLNSLRISRRDKGVNPGSSASSVSEGEGGATPGKAPQFLRSTPAGVTEREPQNPIT